MSDALPFKPVYDTPAPQGTDKRAETVKHRQNLLLGLLVIHLCLLPWALGAMHVGSQFASLLLSASTLTLALWPSKKRGQLDPATSKPSPLGLLLRWPVFWAGLGLLAYVCIQGLNPSWRYFTDAKVWWLEPIRHFPWLPAGVDAPFAKSNAWRCLLVYSSLFLLLCTIQVSLRRRTALRILFWTLAVNGSLLSLLGVFQKLSATKRMFWLWRPEITSFFSTFIYPNHAGAYLNLIFALTAGFALWHLRRADHVAAGAGTAGVLGFLAVLIGIGICLTLSRMSILLLAGQLLVFCGYLFAARRRSRRNLLPLVFALFLAAGLGALLIVPNREMILTRFAQLSSDPGGVLRSRSLVHQATTEMARDRWLLGWGAGSFRHAFPLYAQKYPELCTIGARVTLHWEHAHSDPLETMAELGVAGTLPIAAMLALAAGALIRRRFWHNPVAVGLTMGAAVLAVHSSVDLILQCPAILFTWAVLILVSLRWLELDQPRTGAASAATASMAFTDASR